MYVFHLQICKKRSYIFLCINFLHFCCAKSIYIFGKGLFYKFSAKITDHGNDDLNAITYMM